MMSPAPTDQAAERTDLPDPVRRSRKRHLVLGALALALLGIVNTACLPTSMQPKDAILKAWGTRNAPCAERIAMRESGMDPKAVNPSSGTVGLFQLSPVHATWIKRTYGYTMTELTDPYKNAQVAAGLSTEAWKYYGDGWQPWRYGGAVIPGGGCPA